MFVDTVTVTIKSGHGGKGYVSFARTKASAKGKPNGGDGGRGGDVIFIGERNMNTLLDFTLHRNFIAEDGQPGAGREMTGRSGNHVYVKVPLGTQIIEKATGRIMADITEHEVPVKLLIGGKGGLGNQNFATSTHQAPTYAQPGLPGEEYEVTLELKVMADVGLVGFPNAGKSTLLSVISNARPKIADYPFTTLVPNLGIVKYENFRSFVMADLPGLIKGASEGKGLGLQFLRHVERTRIIVYMISSQSEDFAGDFATLQHEVLSYSDEMKDKPYIKILTKTDLLEEGRDTSFFDLTISSFSLSGLEELKLLIAEKMRDLDKQIW